MGKGAISILRFIAWLNLILGCIGSLIVYIGWGKVFVSSTTYGFISHYETNPIAIALSIALLIEGIVGWAFLLVVCSMANNLISIKENTLAIVNGFSKLNDRDNNIFNSSKLSEKAIVEKGDSSHSIQNESPTTNDDKKELNPLDELRELWNSGQISLTEFNRRKKLLE